MRTKINLIFIILLGLGVSSCSDKAYREVPESFLVDGQGNGFSSSAGNLITSAVKEVHNVDLVLYRRDDIAKNQGLLSRRMLQSDLNQVMGLYPNSSDERDQMLIGTMKGSDIIRLLRISSFDYHRIFFEVAGISYHLHHTGGIEQYLNVVDENKKAIERNKRYKVAISSDFYNSTTAQYRYGLNRSFQASTKRLSVRKSLSTYFKQRGGFFPFLNERRATISETKKSYAGELAIYQIQGNAHRSPYFGHRVKTIGVVTDIFEERDGRGFSVYIQDEKGDGNPKTSDALYLNFKQNPNLEVGDLIGVEGRVYEHSLKGGLGKTSLFNISSLIRLRKNATLPKAVLLGGSGERKIPEHVVSSYRGGDLYNKTDLLLSDGLDFWESLEGMRVKLEKPIVMGFSGGQTSSIEIKSHLNLYLMTEGSANDNIMTENNGVLLNYKSHDHNPEVINLTSRGRDISTRAHYNVGDTFNEDISGLLVFDTSFFGDGEYKFYIESGQTDPSTFLNGKGEVALESRHVTSLEADNEHITIATYNIQNLSAFDVERAKQIGASIQSNLLCPDIINLVEIQDNNGISFSGGPGADQTIKVLIDAIPCGDDVEYVSVNVDPLNHQEGGQPGGNIRVAMIYNKNRVGFKPRGNADALSANRVESNGLLKYNPGRINPEHPAFQRSRRSLAAEFTFNGERFVLIGNHFKSKLGDASPWGRFQPAQMVTDLKREEMAREVNRFVKILVERDPEVNVVVLGDFNAVTGENSLEMLADEVLQDLMTWQNLVPDYMRYTTGHAGSSQPLDYIFTSRNMLKKSPEIDILHINSDYMGRLSDHDPLVARFKINQ